MTLIDVQHLCAENGGIEVLKDVSLQVEKGDCLCIAGEGGTGKSTLIRCMLGAQKPTGGKIVYGEGIAPASIGYLPQQSDYRPDFPSSVREIVRGGLMGKKRAFVWLTKKERQSADEAMAALGVLDLRDRRFSELSGGQRQRVLIARALCAANGVLMLDEPTAGLDAAAASELLRAVRFIHSLGTTIVLAVSDPQAMRAYATNTLLLQRE